MFYISLYIQEARNNPMKKETYDKPDPQLTDPEHLTKILNSSVEIPMRTFDDLRSKITLLDAGVTLGKKRVTQVWARTIRTPVGSTEED